MRAVRFVLLGLLASGCIFDAALPPGAHVRCVDDDECPADAECVATLAECFPRDRPDREPPSLIATAIDPGEAGANDLVTLELTVSETLAAPPRARAGELPFVVDTAASAPAAQRWLLQLRIAGTETEGVLPVTVDLVDVYGNEAVRVPATELTLDFTAPRALSTTVLAPPALRAGARAEGAVTFSESLVAPPVVDVVNATGDALIAELQGSGAQWTVALLATGDETEGDYTVTAVGEDAAGNPSPVVALGSVRLDFKAPSVVEPSAITPSLAAPGQLVRVAVRIDEAYGAIPPAIAIDPAASVGFVLDQSTGTSLSFSALLGPDAVDGAYPLVLTGLADRAGNPAAVDPVLGTLIIDSLPPEVVSLTTSADNLLATDVLTVAFSVSEPLLGEPSVRVGSIPMNPVSGDGVDFSFDLDIGTTTLDGDFQVRVALTDLAGNSVTRADDAWIVSVDAVPPSVVDVSFTPDVVPSGGTTILTVLASEPLDPADPIPVLTWAGGDDPGFVPLDLTFPAYTWSRTVTPELVSASYSLLGLRLVDLAGNVSDVDVGAAFAPVLTVDNEAPEVGPITFVDGRALFSAVPGFNQVVIDVPVADGSGPPALVNATIAGHAMSCAPPAGAIVRCTYDVDENVDIEGTYPLLVTAFDGAGNAGSDSTVITFDYTAPVATNASITFVPAPSNPLPTVSALNDSTVATLTFLLSELPADGNDPLVVASNGSETLGFLRLASTPPVFRYQVVTTPSVDGEYDVTVEAVDHAGNVGTSTLDRALPVDVTAPASPAVGVPGAVRHLRNPWGSDATGGVPAFAVVGTGPATDEDGTVLIETGAGIELARGSATGGAFGPLDLNADQAEVFVRLVDGAGNASIPARVRDGTWTASLAGKVNGSDFPNPHDALGFATRPRIPPHEVSGLALNPSRVWARDNEVAGTQGGAQWITKAAADEIVLPAFGAAYVAASGELFTYGGQVPGPMGITTYTRDSWRIGEGRMSKELLDGAPEARGSPVLAYDSVRDVVVLYGGTSVGGLGGGFLADTWELNGSGWQRRVATSPPGGFNSFGTLFVFQPKRGRCVLFQPAGSQTWEWTGSAWVDRTADAAVAPPPLVGTRGAWDAAREVVVMFGGSNAGASTDVWEWDGSTWRGPLGLTTRPPTAARIAYDPNRRAVVAVASTTASLFIWDGTAWSEEPTRNTVPFGTLYFDEATQRLRLVSVPAIPPFNVTTWELSPLGSWLQALPRTGPLPQRLHHAVTAPPTGDTMLVFGGADSLGLLGDTWRRTGPDWKKLVVAGPGPRSGAGLAWDGASYILFGGRDGGGLLAETWSFDGAAWQQLAPSATPPPRELHDLVYDPARDVVVMVGGAGLRDTWEWSHTTGDWVEVPVPLASSPPASTDRHLGFDDVSARVIWFSQRNRSLYEYWPETPAWIQVGDATAGPVLQSGGAAFDPDRRAFMHFGGNAPGTTSPALSDLWANTLLDGAGQEAVTQSPPAALSTDLTWSAVRERVVLTGGTATSATHWELDGGAHQRPAHLFRFATSSLGVPPRQLVALRTSVSAGGRDGDDGLGASVSLWRFGTYVERATNSAAPDAAEEMVVVEDEPLAVQSLVTADEVRVLVTPNGDNGERRASVATDYVELELTYRLP